jgi:hypothetical protein
MEGICFSPYTLKPTTVVRWYLNLAIVLAKEVLKCIFVLLKPRMNTFGCVYGLIVILKNFVIVRKTTSGPININLAWCWEQREGRLLWPYYVFPVIRLPGSSHHLFHLLALFSVIRGLAVAVLPWMLDLWSSYRTVYMETEASRWILSSALTFAAAILWFLDIVLFNVWRSLSLSFSFRPLFHLADDVFPWFLCFVITLETVALDTPNRVAVLFTDSATQRVPTIFHLWKYDRSPILQCVRMNCWLNTICNALTLALRSVIKQKNNEKYSQMMFFKCNQHKEFYSYIIYSFHYFACPLYIEPHSSYNFSEGGFFPSAGEST